MLHTPALLRCHTTLSPLCSQLIPSLCCHLPCSCSAVLLLLVVWQGVRACIVCHLTNSCGGVVELLWCCVIVVVMVVVWHGVRACIIHNLTHSYILMMVLL